MHSTRLKDKMQIDLAGLPLIVQTYQQAAKSNAKDIIVATDHNDIVEICDMHKINVVLTKESHTSGTDRIAEVVEKLGYAPSDIIINVQGDEPLINPHLINNLAKFIMDSNNEFATIAHPILTKAEILNPNIVKVVLDKDSNALYFSRSPIPFYRDGFNESDFKLPTELNLLRHIGMYAYSVNFLNKYIQMPKSPLESIEALEQLRVLYNGTKIGVLVSSIIPEGGVDTLEDLIRVRQILSGQPIK